MPDDRPPRIRINYQHDKPFPTSGTVSECTINNPDALAGFERMFGVQEYERIIAVEITEVSIKAFFEFRKDTPNAR